MTFNTIIFLFIVLAFIVSALCIVAVELLCKFLRNNARFMSWLDHMIELENRTKQVIRRRLVIALFNHEQS